MKLKNEMSLTFESRSSNEGFARTAVSSFISQLDPTIGEITDIKTAVSEAVTNCIVHAYKESVGLIYISVKIFEGAVVVIKIRDKGCGIADVAQAMEPLFTTGGEERAGLGFAVMQELMDKVRVTSRAGSGTTVHLRRRLSQKLR